MKKIRFLKQTAGRQIGAEEIWADETQANAFIDDGAAEEIDMEDGDVPGEVENGVTDRAMRSRKRKG